MSNVFGFDPRREILIFETEKWNPQRVDLLDVVVSVLYSPTSTNDARKEANLLLTEFQNHPGAWRLSSGIIEFSKSEPTKHLALQILGNFTKKNWLSLAENEQSEVRVFLCNTCLEYSKHNSANALTLSNRNTSGSSAVLSKLNQCLVFVVLHDWLSENWDGFVGELLATGRNDIGVFSNNLKILTLISEEV